MGQYRQLLVLLTEVEPHSAALRRALALAHVSGASVHVLGLFEPSEEHLLREERLNEADIKRQYEHYRAQLTGLVERHRGSGITLTVDSLNAEDIRSQAIDYISELQPDMVIKDSEAASALVRVFGTPLDCALMRGFKGVSHFVPAGPSHCRGVCWSQWIRRSVRRLPFRRASIVVWFVLPRRWRCSVTRTCICYRPTTWQEYLPRT